MINSRQATFITQEKVFLQLFVSGMSENSMEAIQNIKRLCDEHLKDLFELEIIDIYKHPEKLSEEHIIFSPSLIKQLPLPRKLLVGNFSDSEKVIRTLGIKFNQD